MRHYPLALKVACAGLLATLVLVGSAAGRSEPSGFVSGLPARPTDLVVQTPGEATCTLSTGEEGILMSDGRCMGWRRECRAMSYLGESEVPRAAVRTESGPIFLVSGGQDPVHHGVRFDPATGEFRPTAPLHHPRIAPQVVPVDGRRILVFGGTGLDGRLLPGGEVYDMEGDNWTETGGLDVPRNGAVASRLPDGNMLFTGGQDLLGDPGNAAALLDTATLMWTALPPLHRSRCDHEHLQLSDGRILVYGGSSRGAEFQVSVDLFDPASRSWRVLGPPEGTIGAWPVEICTAVEIRPGLVLAFGTEEYLEEDTEGVVWDGARDAPQGWDTDGPTSRPILIDIATGSWTAAPLTVRPRVCPLAVRRDDGTVLVIGGEESQGEPAGVPAESFDLDAMRFSPAPGPVHHLVDPTVWPLSDGRSLLSCGSPSYEVCPIRGYLTDLHELWILPDPQPQLDADYLRVGVGNAVFAFGRHRHPDSESIRFNAYRFDLDTGDWSLDCPIAGSAGWDPDQPHHPGPIHQAFGLGRDRVFLRSVYRTSDRFSLQEYTLEVGDLGTGRWSPVGQPGPAVPGSHIIDIEMVRMADALLALGVEAAWNTEEEWWSSTRSPRAWLFGFEDLQWRPIPIQLPPGHSSVAWIDLVSLDQTGALAVYSLEEAGQSVYLLRYHHDTGRWTPVPFPEEQVPFSRAGWAMSGDDQLWFVGSGAVRRLRTDSAQWETLALSGDGQEPVLMGRSGAEMVVTTPTRTLAYHTGTEVERHFAGPPFGAVEMPDAPVRWNARPQVLPLGDGRFFAYLCEERDVLDDEASCTRCDMAACPTDGAVFDLERGEWNPSPLPGELWADPSGRGPDFLPLGDGALLATSGHGRSAFYLPRDGSTWQLLPQPPLAREDRANWVPVSGSRVLLVTGYDAVSLLLDDP